jgi:hypothetical protein
MSANRWTPREPVRIRTVQAVDQTETVPAVGLDTDDRPSISPRLRAATIWVGSEGRFSGLGCLRRSSWLMDGSCSR